jgi:hypothetical protein
MMPVIRLETAQKPLDRSPLADSAVGLIRRALALGLLNEEDGPISRLDLDLMRRIADRAAAVGIGGDAAIALRRRPLRLDQLGQIIERLDEALRESPLPDREASELLRVFARDDLAALIGTSTVSLGRYLGGARSWPDDLANRIHWLALVVSDLAGAYNEFGIRRWFYRQRAQLGGRSPREVMGTDWDPDDADVLRVRDLAAALVGAGAAT